MFFTIIASPFAFPPCNIYVSKIIVVATLEAFTFVVAKDVWHSPLSLFFSSISPRLIALIVNKHVIDKSYINILIRY